MIFAKSDRWLSSQGDGKTLPLLVLGLLLIGNGQILAKFLFKNSEIALYDADTVLRAC